MKSLSRMLIVAGVVAVTCVSWDGGAAFAAGGEKQLVRASRAARQGDFEAAEKLYRELIAKDPQDLPARLGLSFALLKQRKLLDAYDAAARVIAVDPTSPRAHALLGAALLAGGDFTLSVEEFRTALSFKEDEALAIAGLAMVDFHENRAGAALAGLRRAIHIDPNEPDYLFNFAKAAARSERYREAADAYENFLRIAPRTDADRRAYIRGLIEFLRYLGTQRQLYDANGAARAQIPFEIVNNRPVINIRINNSRDPLRFVIDTGSGMCVVSEEAAKRIGLRPIARGGTARAIGGGGRFDIIYGFLSSIHLGEARIDNVPVYIRHFHSTSEEIDGYIGLSILAKYLATLDYGTRTLNMDRDARLALPSIQSVTTAANAATLANVIELPIRSTSNGIWCGVVKLAGVEKPQHFIIDTGATISVVSEALSTRETLERFVQKRRLKVYGAAGVAEDVPMLLLPRVAVGPYAYPNLSAAVLDMESINETSGFEQSGILGGNILRFFRVTFDFGRGVLRLEPLLNSPIMPVADASLEPINTTPPF